jgi:hypothetical protein
VERGIAAVKLKQVKEEQKEEDEYQVNTLARCRRVQYTGVEQKGKAASSMYIKIIAAFDKRACYYVKQRGRTYCRCQGGCQRITEW